MLVSNAVAHLKVVPTSTIYGRNLRMFLIS
jgi:hypothetical protein